MNIVKPILYFYRFFKPIKPLLNWIARFCACSLFSLPCYADNIDLPASKRSIAAEKRVLLRLTAEIKKIGSLPGSPVFIRIFKDPGILELWVKNNKNQFSLFKTYEICTFSGVLGPKTKRGDKQAPEGFYYVTAKRLNPWSRYHLSFNLGYPNPYDRYHGRTGSALMVHGECVSIGCYAMTNPYIDEIYTLVSHALKNGQPFVRVHIFPFEMTDENLARYKTHQWHSFWVNLKEGYDFFEKYHTPPNVEVSRGVYTFE